MLIGKWKCCAYYWRELPPGRRRTVAAQTNHHSLNLFVVAFFCFFTKQIINAKNKSPSISSLDFALIIEHKCVLQNLKNITTKKVLFSAPRQLCLVSGPKNSETFLYKCLLINCAKNLGWTHTKKTPFCEAPLVEMKQADPILDTLWRIFKQNYRRSKK